MSRRPLCDSLPGMRESPRGGATKREDPTMTRPPGARWCWRTVAALAVAIACLGTFVAPGAEAASKASKRSRIDRLVRNAIARYGLKAVILQVTVKGRPMMTRAYGESMTGVPATTDMRFRNGAVAISYMSTLLLRLVDQGK